MHRLLFLGRIAFICNIFFIVCLLLRHTHFPVNQGLTEFVIITGWIMSVILNIIFAISLAMFIKKKETRIHVWLFAFNLFWLVFQFFYYLLIE